MNPGEIREMARSGAIVEQYRSLVHSIVNRFMGHGVDRDDLVQEGLCGLIRAAASYDDSRSEFHTHATMCIQRYIRMAILKTGSLVRPSRNSYKMLARYRRLRNRMSFNTVQEPTSEAVMDAMGLTPKQRESLMAADRCRSDVVRLDNRPWWHRDSVEAESALTSDSIEVEMDDAEEFSHLVREVDGILSGMSERYQDIIRMRFGIGRDRPVSVAEVAATLGVTHHAAHSMQNRAMLQLRERAGVA